MTEADLPAVVEMHVALIEDALFPLLGRGFMEELYRGLLGSPHALCLVYEEEGVAGFIVGAYSSRRLATDLLRRRGMLLLLKALPFLMRHPAKWGSLAGILRYNRLTELPGIDAEMPYIALRRGLRGKGLGKDLVREVLGRFRKKGIELVKVTAHEDNIPPNRLLRELGFELVRRVDIFGKANNLYRGEIGRVLADEG
jgi:ribosomal protein S18 acetylase RimI-like enzyme